MKYTIKVLPPKEVDDRPINSAEATLIFTSENTELSTVTITLEMPHFETTEEYLDFINAYTPTAKWRSELYGNSISDSVKELSEQDYEREVDL